MLELTLLCNAGMALDDGTDILLIDVPNMPSPPFYTIPESIWLRILNREPPYDRVCGLYFTHTHPDHCCPGAVRKYHTRHPEIPVIIPGEGSGTVRIKGFTVQYQSFPHAPLPEGEPPHAVTWLSAGGKTLYIAADAAPDWQLHRRFLAGRKASCGIWNASYLSYPQSRALLAEAAEHNLIYHMPKERPDASGIWKKCEANFRRYPEELHNVEVLEQTPVPQIL